MASQPINIEDPAVSQTGVPINNQGPLATVIGLPINIEEKRRLFREKFGDNYLPVKIISYLKRVRQYNGDGEKAMDYLIKEDNKCRAKHGNPMIRLISQKLEDPLPEPPVIKKKTLYTREFLVRMLEEVCDTSTAAKSSGKVSFRWKLVYDRLTEEGFYVSSSDALGQHFSRCADPENRRSRQKMVPLLREQDAVEFFALCRRMKEAATSVQQRKPKRRWVSRWLEACRARDVAESNAVDAVMANADNAEVVDAAMANADNA